MDDTSPITFFGIILTDWIIAFCSVVSLITIIKLFIRDKQKDEEIKQLSILAQQSIKQTDLAEERNRHLETQVIQYKISVRPKFVKAGGSRQESLVIPEAKNVGAKAFNVIVHEFQNEDFIITKCEYQVVDTDGLISIPAKFKKQDRSQEYFNQIHFEVNISYKDKMGNRYSQLLKGTGSPSLSYAGDPIEIWN